MLGESQLAGKTDSRAPAPSSGLLGYLQSRTHSAPSYKDAFSPLSYALHMSDQVVCSWTHFFIYTVLVPLWPFGQITQDSFFCLFVLMARQWIHLLVSWSPVLFTLVYEFLVSSCSLLCRPGLPDRALGRSLQQGQWYFAATPPSRTNRSALCLWLEITINRETVLDLSSCSPLGLGTICISD